MAGTQTRLAHAATPDADAGETTWSSQMRPVDVVQEGTRGLSARPGRMILTAVGIAVGIAAIVAVLGISASSKAELLRVIDQLGTNLVRVSAGQSFFGEAAELPDESVAMTERIGPVQGTAATTLVDARVRRNPLVPETETGGISVLATTLDLPETLSLDVVEGRFLDEATAAVPAAVVGTVAAERLGISGEAIGTADAPRVWVEDDWFTVVGILESSEVPVADAQLHPDIDRSILIGYPAAERVFGADSTPSTIFARIAPEFVDDVYGVLPSTVNPERPNEVDLARPSDILLAREETDRQLTNLLIGLGGVSLLVGGLAIANVMVMSVLERRVEIGVRRALGATKRHIRMQFVVESVALAGIGGIAGVALGTLVTAGYAVNRGFPVAVPLLGLVGAIAVALLVGAIAGFYPAMRAANIPPSEAVRAGG